MLFSKNNKVKLKKYANWEEKIKIHFVWNLKLGIGLGGEPSVSDSGLVRLSLGSNLVQSHIK